MANITLKGLLKEAEDFKARSKETGKLVHFKSKDSYDAAIKAGSHEDPKAEKGDEPKADVKPNDMFGGDYAKDRGDGGLGWGPETDRTPVTSLPKKASQLNYKHSNTVANTVNKEAGLDGYAQTDDNSGAIIYNAGKGDMPTYTLYMGSNVDYGKPDEFRVSLEPTYGNDPSKLQGNVDKSFKSAEEAMAFAVEVAKKYKKELEMDDEAPKASPKINSKNWKPDEDGSMSDEASDDVQNYLNDVLGADGLAEVDYNTGNIQYGLADSENSIFVGYMDGTYNVSFEGPSMDIDKINQSYKSFKNPKEALQYAGELAKANREGLEQKQESTKLTSMIKKIKK